MAKNSKHLTENKFEEFVLSVIEQMCLRSGTVLLREFRSDNTKVESRIEVTRDFSAYRYDAFAPYGFGEFKKPVIIEIKYNITSMHFTDLGNSQSNDAVSLYIINQKLSQKEIAARIKGRNVVVWDGSVIDQWRKKYPIDYYGFFSDEIPHEDVIEFELKISANKQLLKQAINDQRVSVSLGAGVSYAYGALGWDALIAAFYEEIKKAGKIDNIKEVQKKIGGTSIINGQFAEENLKDFMSSLWQGLYGKYLSGMSPLSGTTLYIVTELIEKMHENRRFCVITYNYDDFLEQCLTVKKLQYNVVYNSQIDVNDLLTIYHPHGYLPYCGKKKGFSEYRDFLVFSETEYHKLYNDPYSWAMVLQNHLYRENTFLFVGCSLSDPNLRRILDETRVPGKMHYALMLTDGLTKKDQLIVHRHFMRMGVECIWADDINELEHIIRSLI